MVKTENKTNTLMRNTKAHTKKNTNTHKATHPRGRLEIPEIPETLCAASTASLSAASYRALVKSSAVPMSSCAAVSAVRTPRRCAPNWPPDTPSPVPTLRTRDTSGRRHARPPRCAGSRIQSSQYPAGHLGISRS
jgi:hypothetical protein